MSNLTAKQKELIEKMGVFQEKAGMPPTESRIVALLLVSDKTELTFDEIREELNVSKSAVSNALNTLLLLNKIEYITKPGDRKRYFKSNLSNFQNNAEEGLLKMLKVSEIMKEIHEIRTSETPDFNKDLADVIDFIEYMQKELVVIFEQWKSNRNEKN